jgi:hypothetical protein
MSEAAQWQERVTRTVREATAFAAFVGEWAGEGVAHGEPIAARMMARPLLDGSFVEVRELGDGHEDRCFYRFEPEDGTLRVLHLLPGATMREYPVERTADGLVWITPPSEPAVEWRFYADRLECDVIWPGEAEPEVRMVWRPLARG